MNLYEMRDVYEMDSRLRVNANPPRPGLGANQKENVAARKKNDY